MENDKQGYFESYDGTLKHLFKWGCPTLHWPWYFLFCLGFFTPFVYITDNAILMGATETQAAMLLSILGAFNTVGKFSLVSWKIICNGSIKNKVLEVKSVSESKSSLNFCSFKKGIPPYTPDPLKFLQDFFEIPYEMVLKWFALSSFCHGIQLHWYDYFLPDRYIFNVINISTMTSFL